MTRAEQKEQYAKDRSLSYDLKQAPTQITIQTRVPDKWRLIDLETGDVWRYDADSKRTLAAHDFCLMMAPDRLPSKPEYDPRWPIFKKWVESEVLGGYTEREMEILWIGWSASHLVVHKPEARPPQEYVRELATNKDGKPLKSAATTHSLAIKMTELMVRLKREGFLDLKWPEIRPQCNDNWNADYATCCTAYADDMELGDFFDLDNYLCRFEQYLREFFGADKDPNIEVHFRRRAQEIEVYRTSEKAHGPKIASV